MILRSEMSELCREDMRSGKRLMANLDRDLIWPQDKN